LKPALTKNGLNIKYAAELTGYTTDNIRKLAASGKIKHSCGDVIGKSTAGSVV
jgi:hypothetical protein